MFVILGKFNAAPTLLEKKQEDMYGRFMSLKKRQLLNGNNGAVGGSGGAIEFNPLSINNETTSTTTITTAVPVSNVATTPTSDMNGVYKNSPAVRVEGVRIVEGMITSSSCRMTTATCEVGEVNPSVERKLNKDESIVNRELNSSTEYYDKTESKNNDFTNNDLAFSTIINSRIGNGEVENVVDDKLISTYSILPKEICKKVGSKETHFV